MLFGRCLEKAFPRLNTFALEALANTTALCDEKILKQYFSRDYFAIRHWLRKNLAGSSLHQNVYIYVFDRSFLGILKPKDLRFSSATDGWLATRRRTSP